MDSIAMPNLVHLTAQTFVSGLWQGIALVGAAALCLRLIPGIGASVRFVVWAFVFGLLVGLPLVHLGSGPATGSAGLHLGASWAYAIVAIWVGLSAFRAAQLVLQAVRVRQIWKRALPLDARPCEVSGRTAQICSSTDVDSPAVIGFFSPRLLLPEALLATLTPVELDHIALHECEHLRRRDDWLNLLQKVALVLFPLNPALLWVDRRLGLERELACDAGVVRFTGQPLDYAHSLTRLAEHRLHYRRIALALSAFSRQSELSRRVYTLLRPARGLSSRQAAAILCLLTVALTAGSLEMARAPRFISFSNPIAPALTLAASTSVTPQALPVVYRPTSQPYATLLKATMPSSPMHPRLRANHGPRRQFYAVQTSFSPTYAAVPFGDGWLIIRL